MANDCESAESDEYSYGIVVLILDLARLKFTSFVKNNTLGMTSTSKWKRNM